MGKNAQFLKIAFTFLALLMLAWLIDRCAAIAFDMRAAHLERQTIAEIIVTYRRFTTICPHPEIGELQAYMDCRDRSAGVFRTDI